MSRVLIGYSACPLTRRAFEQAGHDVWTCDLLPARDGSASHFQRDVWEVLLAHHWDFAVLHPMCTYLTVSAAWAFGDGPYHQKVKPGTLVGAARRAARDEALENFRRLLGLPFPVAIENPSPSFIGTAIRPPDQVIQPHQFGNDASKATGLWLTRGVPLLRPTKRVPGRLVQWKGKTVERWANQTDSGQNKLTPSDQRWLERSKTYPGIAAAMGAQWGAWLERGEPEFALEASMNLNDTDGVAVPGTVREFLEHWSHEGHLQTFEDRERFRKAARALLADGVAPSDGGKR